LAGTDLFYPPMGGWIARWVAAPGVDPGALVPYAPQMYDSTADAAMRVFRAPIVQVHEDAAFAPLDMVFIPLVAVVVPEVRAGGTLVSAMFSGRKVLSEPPADPRGTTQRSAR